MSRTNMLQEIRTMRFAALLERAESKTLSQADAAELLGMSERTFRRWRDRYREEGAPGLLDRRIGKASAHRAPAAEIARMLGLYEARYTGFTVQHFHEQLTKRHGYQLGYTLTRLALQKAGLVRSSPKRSAHRKKRPRRPMAGMMLHQDGSRHAWLPGDARAYDLIATVDDATSELYSAFLVAEEGTASSLRALGEVIAAKGLFCSLYTDRGSHYFHTPKAGEKVARNVQTQVGRALSQLGIEHIAAYSPEARGRSERQFRTLQDRLPKELALAGITSLDDANRWIASDYLADHNARFAVAAEQPGSAFVPDRAGAWRDILCVQEDRQVGNDNTIKWRRHVLQIPPSALRPHFVRATVRVREYPDGTIAVHLGPHRLALYDQTGALLPSPRDPVANAAATIAARGRNSGPARSTKSGQQTRYENRST